MRQAPLKRSTSRLLFGRGLSLPSCWTCPRRLAGRTAAPAAEHLAERGVPEWLQRSELIMGSEALHVLGSSTVVVVGLGGVGSWCAEALVRSGLGTIVIVDGDVVDSSNRNRQLPALSSTVGKSKVDIMTERLRDINPELNVVRKHSFLEPETARQLALQPCDYIVDCIDSVAPKVEMLATACAHGQPIISSMGAGGKISPQFVQVADISKTHHDAFARTVRSRLRKRGLYKGLPVIYSPEPTVANSMAHTEQKYKRSYYGTMSFMPAVFGMHAAAHVIKELAASGSRVTEASDSGALAHGAAHTEHRVLASTPPEGFNPHLEDEKSSRANNHNEASPGSDKGSEGYMYHI